MSISRYITQDLVWAVLAMDSPAALLIDFPLSVYQLVVNCLRVTNAKKGSPDRRIPVHIQMLGVEVELNHLPLYVCYNSDYFF